MFKQVAWTILFASVCLLVTTPGRLFLYRRDASNPERRDDIMGVGAKCEVEPKGFPMKVGVL